MRNTILKGALYSSMLVAVLSFSSCKKEGDADSTTEMNDTTGIVPESEAPKNPVMDTVIEKDGDTVVRTGGGKNENPLGTQVP
mgnify:FL=1